jgi:hypothetical protein
MREERGLSVARRGRLTVARRGRAAPTSRASHEPSPPAGSAAWLKERTPPRRASWRPRTPWRNTRGPSPRSKGWWTERCRRPWPIRPRRRILDTSQSRGWTRAVAMRAAAIDTHAAHTSPCARRRPSACGKAAPAARDTCSHPRYSRARRAGRGARAAGGPAPRAPPSRNPARGALYGAGTFVGTPRPHHPSPGDASSRRPPAAGQWEESCGGWGLSPRKPGPAGPCRA